MMFSRWWHVDAADGSLQPSYWTQCRHDLELCPTHRHLEHMEFLSPTEVQELLESKSKRKVSTPKSVAKDAKRAKKMVRKLLTLDGT